MANQQPSTVMISNIWRLRVDESASYWSAMEWAENWERAGGQRLKERGELHMVQSA